MSLPPVESVPPLPEASEPMSLPSRLLNVFAAPAEVFNHVKVSSFAAANWVVPALLFVVVSWVCSFLILSQPNIKQQIAETATKAIEQQVEQGKLSQQQADQAMAMIEKTVLIAAKVAAYASPPFVVLLGAFGWGLLIWLIGTKVFKADFGYLKAVEVSGLCAMLSLLDVIVRSLLILVTGSIFASVSPTLIIREFDPQSVLHGVLALLNLMTFWILGVRALGLARLSGKGFGISAARIFGLWLGYNALALGGAAAMRMIFSK